MEGGKSRATVRRDINMAHSTVTAITDNANKIKKRTEAARRKNATTLRHSRGPVIRKIE
jgi:hypothetical protein